MEEDIENFAEEPELSESKNVPPSIQSSGFEDNQESRTNGDNVYKN